MKKKIGILTTFSMLWSKIIYAMQMDADTLKDVEILYGPPPELIKQPTIVDILLKIGKIAIVPIILIIGIVAIIRIKKKKNKKDIDDAENIEEK